MNFIEENQKDNIFLNEFQLVNLALIVFLFFAFLINLLIVLIHSKQKSLRKGFFIVIFIQIIMEGIITFSLLIINIIYITKIDIGVYFIIFPILFNFGYITNILYNIRIMIFLMTLDKRKDESFNYDDLKEDLDIDDNFTQNSKQSTVPFISHSYKSFHYFSFLLSLTHTISYTLYLFIQEKINETIHNWKWYCFFFCYC